MSRRAPGSRSAIGRRFAPIAWSGSATLRPVAPAPAPLSTHPPGRSPRLARREPRRAGEQRRHLPARRLGAARAWPRGLARLARRRHPAHPPLDPRGRGGDLLPERHPPSRRLGGQGLPRRARRRRGGRRARVAQDRVPRAPGHPHLRSGRLRAHALPVAGAPTSAHAPEPRRAPRRRLQAVEPRHGRRGVRHGLSLPPLGDGHAHRGRSLLRARNGAGRGQRARARCRRRRPRRPQVQGRAPAGRGSRRPFSRRARRGAARPP